MRHVITEYQTAIIRQGIWEIFILFLFLDVITLPVSEAVRVVALHPTYRRLYFEMKLLVLLQQKTTNSATLKHCYTLPRF